MRSAVDVQAAHMAHFAAAVTLRRRFFSIAGRLTRSARGLTLYLPERWPWAEKFIRALARLQAIPPPA